MESDNNKPRKYAKPGVIAQAYWDAWFNGDSNEYISKEDLEYRRSQCKLCSFNSANTSEEHLSLIQTLRTKLNILGDFCTICECPISKKTLAPEEVCARTIKNLPPLWNRITTFTETCKAKLINLTPMKVDLESEKFNYLVYVGRLGDDMSFSLGLESKRLVSDITHVRSNCRCMTVRNVRKKEKNIVFDVNMVYTELPKGKFSNWIYVKFKDVMGEEYSFGIKVIGEK